MSDGLPAPDGPPAPGSPPAPDGPPAPGSRPAPHSPPVPEGPPAPDGPPAPGAVGAAAVGAAAVGGHGGAGPIASTDDGAAGHSRDLDQRGADAETIEGDGGWSRVHPVTPLLRSWQLFLVGFFIFSQDVGESLIFGGDGGFSTLLTENRLIGTAVTAGLIALIIGGAWLSWYRTRYRVTSSALEFERGVVFRHQRRAPLDRLQAVDLTEPLLARMVGLAKVTLEVAGGSGSSVDIAYLTKADCLRLRDHLLSVASGVASDDASTPPQIGQAPEHLSVEVPLGRLLASTLLSVALPAVGLMIAAVVVFVVTDEIGSLLPIAFIVIATITGAWTAFARWFEFRVASAADGVRIRRGLFEQRTQTVPPGRVQAVRLSQPLMWRLLGWWQVDVNVAGYGSGSGDRSDTDTVLLPVGTRSEALAVLAFVIDDVALDDDALTGRGGRGGFVAAPTGARWVDPIAWRRHGFRVDPSVLVLRGGRLRRRVDVVPHARTQSSAVHRGPLQRRLGLATFELHSTPGPIRPRVEHLRQEVVVGLLEDQAVRARAARATATDEWLAPAGTGAADVDG
ncbi:MAG: PH domain-containing protein [Acidimicrobiales bacterium]